PRDHVIPARAAYQLADHSQLLKREGLLLLTSLDDRVAIGAAYAILDDLQIDDSERRLLSFDGNVQDKADLVMQFFTENKTERQQMLTAIVVDALNAEARTFLDWLLSGAGFFVQRIRAQLNSNRMVLLCLAPEDYISQVCEGKKTRLNSPVRRIPFLTPLLAHY